MSEQPKNEKSESEFREIIHEFYEDMSPQDRRESFMKLMSEIEAHFRAIRELFEKGDLEGARKKDASVLSRVNLGGMIDKVIKDKNSE